MHPRIRTAVLFSLVLIAAVSLTGCCRLLPSLPWCPSEQIKPSEPELTARREITRNRNYTESMVSTIKDKLKGKEAEEAYLDARSLYDKAMNENNAWLSLLALSIENNENLEGSNSFKEQTKAAADATDSFLAYGRQLTSKPSIKMSSIQLKSVLPINELLTTLVTNGITIWKENKAQRAKERMERAENIRKELTWKRWKQIE